MDPPPVPRGAAAARGPSARRTASSTTFSTKNLSRNRTSSFAGWTFTDRKSTRLNSSHSQISYAVFCLKKKHEQRQCHSHERPNRPSQQGVFEIDADACQSARPHDPIDFFCRSLRVRRVMDDSVTDDIA